jgi:predicted ATPase
MHLTWFQVQGYKNLLSVLRLDPLGRINVLHGDNNVGKSNLLEAIGLFFLLLHVLREEGSGGPSMGERYARRAPPTVPNATPDATVRTATYFTQRGFAPGEIFDLAGARPIELAAALQLDADDLVEGDPPWLAEPIQIAFRLERADEDVAITLTRAARHDGAVIQFDAASEADWARVSARIRSRRGGDTAQPRFALIRADRSVVAEPAPPPDRPSSLAVREPLPADLGHALHEAEGATGLERERFDRFVTAMSHFAPLVGAGQWRMRYKIAEGRAELVFESDGTRTPLSLMGSGIQQLATMIARLLFVGADVVALEEPELNLRWRAQHLLREALSEIVRSPGPSQLLLTSHSPAFEFEPEFFLIERTATGPSIMRRPREDAPRLLNPDVEMPPEGARAPLSYVTTDGLVRVPEHVRVDLGLEQGGGVAFVREKDHGHYRMLSDAQFLDLVEPREMKP